MGVKKPPYQAAEINPHWRSNTEWHVSVAQWRIVFSLSFFFFWSGQDQLLCLTLKENQMREIILEESPPLTRPFGFDELFAKPLPVGFLLLLFIFNRLAFFTFRLPSACLSFLCREYCPVDVQHIVKFLRWEKEAQKAWQESDFVPVSSVWTPNTPTQGF